MIGPDTSERRSAVFSRPRPPVCLTRSEQVRLVSAGRVYLDDADRESIRAPHPSSSFHHPNERIHGLSVVACKSLRFKSYSGTRRRRVVRNGVMQEKVSVEVMHRGERGK